MEGEPPKRARRSKRLALGCLGMGCGLPLLTLLILTLAYLANNRPPHLPLPVRTPPVGNVYNDLVTASNMAKSIVHKAPASMLTPPPDGPGMMAATAATVKDSEPALALMRRSLGKPFLLPNENTAPSLGQKARFRELARTNSGLIEYYRIRGRWFEATQASLDGYELAVMIPRGGSLVAFLSARACESIALYHFESLLPHLNATDLSVVATRLDRIAAERVSARDVILEEGYQNVAEYEKVLRDPQASGLRDRYRMIADLAGVESGSRPTFRQAKAIAGFAFANKSGMMNDLLDYYKRLADESTRPYTGPTRLKPPDNLFAEYETMGPILTGTVLSSHTVGDLLRVETALYRYRADHNRFPARLDELAPRYLAQVPLDPFGGGHPFHYRAAKADLLLYSVGSDAVDNGGVPAQMPAAQVPGDIVAGRIYPRTKARL